MKLTMMNFFKFELTIVVLPTCAVVLNQHHHKTIYFVEKKNNENMSCAYMLTNTFQNLDSFI